MDMNQGSIYRIFNRRQRLVLGKKSAGKSSVIMRLHLPGRQRTYLELVIFIPIKIVQKSPFLARSKNRDLPGFIGLIGPISIRRYLVGVSNGFTDFQEAADSVFSHTVFRLSCDRPNISLMSFISLASSAREEASLTRE